MLVRIWVLDRRFRGGHIVRHFGSSDEANRYIQSYARGGWNMERMGGRPLPNDPVKAVQDYFKAQPDEFYVIYHRNVNVPDRNVNVPDGDMDIVDFTPDEVNVTYEALGSFSRALVQNRLHMSYTTLVRTLTSARQKLQG
jgi:hypothetical protein